MTRARPACRLPFPAWAALALVAPAFADDESEPAGSAAADDSERTPVHTVVPGYPEKAREQRLEGEVQVCFYIDRAGIPYRIAVRKSTHRIFERPSIRAVQASTYAPLPPGKALPSIKSCRTFRYALERADPL